MKRKLFLIFNMLLICVVGAFAQSRTITGKVTSGDDGSPIHGASVVIKGTNLGVITDGDGSFSINANPEQTLVISFIGNVTQEVLVGNRTSINVVLESDFRALDEIVVTGLGISRSEKSLGYSVQQIEGDKLQLTQETNVLNSLEVRFPVFK